MSRRWAVFISGRGSNLATFLDSQNEVEIGLVVSDRANAYGLKRAQRMGIQTAVIDRDWDKTHELLLAHNIQAIFLAGFMKIIPSHFLGLWRSRIFNIHPSLLPMYQGLKSIDRAVADKADVGATVHKVIPQVDQGKICLQKVAVKKDEIEKLSLEKIKFYVHTIEHRLVRKWVSHWQNSMTSSY